MSRAIIERAIANKKLICPECDLPVKKFDQLVETVDSVWDGAGDSKTEVSGCKVTLTCDNGSCKWKERTEYWEDYIEE